MHATSLINSPVAQESSVLINKFTQPSFPSCEQLSPSPEPSALDIKHWYELGLFNYFGLQNFNKIKFGHNFNG